MGEIKYTDNSTNIVSTMSNDDVISTGKSDGTVGGHTLAYIIVPLGAVALVLVIAFVVSITAKFRIVGH